MHSTSEERNGRNGIVRREDDSCFRTIPSTTHSAAETAAINNVKPDFQNGFDVGIAYMIAAIGDRMVLVYAHW